MLSSKSCEIFNIPFFQFAQLKKYCPEEIPLIKANYKAHWEIWKKLHLDIAHQLGQPFSEPHIERWCNGWQVRAHFFTYYKYEFNKNSAAIISVILNRRRLQVCLDWHCYRADRSQINVQQYNQWSENLDREKYSKFDIWNGKESEYDDFRKVSQISAQELILADDEDFWCIGRNVEKEELDNIDAVEFIYQTIRDLLPLYEKCHQ
ncbi:HI_0552 family protein [Mannheimia pernigra]|uniref:HI_0552 family protein n=1 Tax=Mannheimia pernigra TaxID=111844 RepID=UPI001317E162|nr:HI_0552 family protein [Mannheimia pernigra]QHB16750.1 hypothetical protein GM695_01055 [Mannheimia pernigra]